jgi:uncharacterized membrane protein
MMGPGRDPMKAAAMFGLMTFTVVWLVAFCPWGAATVAGIMALIMHFGKGRHDGK